MFGVGSARVPSGSRLLTPLSGGYRDAGILLAGLGLADALALMAVIQPGPYYWAGVIAALLLFAVGYVALDHSQKWLTTAIEGAVAIPNNACVRDHHGLAQTALLMMALYGALNAGWVLWGRPLGMGSGLVPGMMIAQGVTLLVRAERVRSWQRDHNSELLASFGWKRPHQRGYFIRSLALS
jgi:hypothetical protein